MDVYEAIAKRQTIRLPNHLDKKDGYSVTFSFQRVTESYKAIR